ncbi:MAG: class I SAM-dependent methyltransferase [Pseudomonadota bacterium]
MSLKSSNAGYAQEAPRLLQRYEGLASETVHAQWRQWIPIAPSRVLDIGAGTGRDAAWFVSLGHSVLAVEPTDELREGAQRLHPERSITWLKDQLPDLAQVKARSELFDVIMLNAVWMHLTEEERKTGFETLVSLMAPGANLFMSQRHGPVPEGRRMFDVSGDETTSFARAHGLRILYNERNGSQLAENRNLGVEWTCLVFEKS